MAIVAVRGYGLFVVCCQLLGVVSLLLLCGVACCLLVRCCLVRAACHRRVPGVVCCLLYGVVYCWLLLVFAGSCVLFVVWVFLVRSVMSLFVAG